MSQIKEYIKIAIMNIRHNKGRSVLTMLGIIIGIASVIMVLSIGNGVKKQVNDELDGMAGGQIEIYVDSTRKDTNVSFTREDVDFISNNIANVKGATPYANMWGSATGPKAEADLRMLGGYPALEYNGKEKIIKGRYFNEGDLEAESLVCVMDENSARLLYGTTDVVGLTFEATFWGITQEIKIIGIREASAASLINMGYSADYVSADMPLTTLCSKYGLYYEDFTDIVIFSESAECSNQVAKDAKSALEARHHCIGENQIMISSFADVSSEFNQILDIITVFISLVAAISLLVGGIGVMNIMLVSVTERTREIGIRKSLGARTNSIMLQFLAEAGIMTLIGGIIGIIIGVAGAYGICAIAGVTASISPATILITTAFSCGVGLFFGIYPAKRAAQLRPIDALRHE